MGGLGPSASWGGGAALKYRTSLQCLGVTDLTWPGVLGHLLSGSALAEHEAAWAMERIMSGEATPAQFGAFVAALRAKGETVEEIAGFVATMRRMAVPVPEGGTRGGTYRPGGGRAGEVHRSAGGGL